ncbi:P-loop containing nucleoside triphosphate hydrolase protein [Phialemonium atrogriseum]|uniref:P-loop containing nucleoside triphosphate hydrolase protein n=1 Tax=Phialemonium atrogriseum TaxID=1093897 RepID=A0AAJ0CA89_9PEZI|nr:P-loop containing nucleoside triphosphate hydrolase protein [Phialemonium atrogriseum]KAK1772427.1 P-loop containing nucleoside triphosphate hydrolase protein [Phialemonium atrogriseum]
MQGTHDMREMYRQVAKIRGLPQSRPLYGHILINEFGQGKFNPTQRFNDWLGDACLCTEQDDFFHQWLRNGGHRKYAKPEEEDRQLKRKRGEAKEYPTPLESLHTLEMAWMDYMSKKQARVDELTSRMERLLQPPLSAKEVNNKKRPAETPLETPSANGHPSKRARVIGSIKRRLSGALSESNGGQKSTATVRSSVMGFFNKTGVKNPFLGATPSLSPSAFQRIRICLIGDRSTGKTTLVKRLRTDLFVETEPSPSYYLDRHPIDIDGTTYLLELWDIPGDLDPEESSPLMGAFFHASVLCFSLESDASLQSMIRQWPGELRANLVEAPCFVAGLKRDLRPTCPTLRLRFLNEAIPVSHDEGEKAALQIGAEAYFECSGKTGDGVQDMFRDVARLALQHRAREDRRRAERVRREKAKEFAKDTGRRVSWLLCGHPTNLP